MRIGRTKKKPEKKKKEEDRNRKREALSLRRREKPKTEEVGRKKSLGLQKIRNYKIEKRGNSPMDSIV